MSFWEVAVPTWLQGVGTVGAFATGGFILLRELRRDRGQRERDEQQQASAISAWFVRAEAEAGRNTKISRVNLNNASNSPVYDLALSYAYRDDKSEVAYTDNVGVLPPGRTARKVPEAVEEIWIKSAGGWLRSKPPSEQAVEDPATEPWPWTVSLSFRDSTGVRWNRLEDGTVMRQEA